MIETTHVRLRIIDPNKEIFNPETGDTVRGSEVIKQMKINNVWRTDRDGRYAAVQYSGQTFKFREKQAYSFPQSLATALRRNSVIVVGSDSLNGPMIPFLEIGEVYELSEQKKVAAPYACPICGEDQKNPARLARHLGEERKKNPALFVEEKTQWDVPEPATATDGEDADN